MIGLLHGNDEFVKQAVVFTDCTAYAMLIPMKTQISIFILILSVILLFSNIQKTYIVSPTAEPLKTHLMCYQPQYTHYPTYTPLTCPEPEYYAIAISEEGIEFIKHWEGLHQAMYSAPEGDCSVGYGHRIHSGPCNSLSWPSYVSEKQADILLRDDIKKIEFEFFRNVTVKLTQYQYDALISIAFNFGWGSFAKKEFINLLETGQAEKIPASIRYYKADINGVYWEGLSKRREAEAKLFEKGDYGL